MVLGTFLLSSKTSLDSEDVSVGENKESSSKLTWCVDRAILRFLILVMYMNALKQEYIYT